MKTKRKMGYLLILVFLVGVGIYIHTPSKDAQLLTSYFQSHSAKVEEIKHVKTSDYDSWLVYTDKGDFHANVENGKVTNVKPFGE